MRFSALMHQSTAKRRDMILNGAITPTLLLLSLPTIMMGTVQSAIPVIDGLFINNCAGTIAASAVTYCGPIVMMMGALAQGLSVAGMAIIGQLNGKGELAQSRKIATQIVVSTFMLGILIAPLLVLLAFPISSHVDKEISSNVFLYLSLYAMVIPFQFMEFVYNAIKNSNGKPEAPFIRMVIMLILKIVFNTLFIAVFRYGIVGSVLATLLANVLICVWMFYELFIHKGEDKLELRGYRFDPEIMRELFRIGIPSMISSVMLNLGFFLINNEVEKYGPITLNGQGIANNITAVCFIVPSSFGSSVTTMVSMNVGAGQGDKARKSTIVGCVISAITAAILIALVVPLSRHLTVLFTRQPDVLSIADKALSIYTYSVVGFGICMVELGAFIGLGRTVVPLVMGLLRVWLLRYLFILATERYLGVYAVFWGNLFSNYAAAAITTVLFLKVKWVTVVRQDRFEKQRSKPEIE